MALRESPYGGPVRHLWQRGWPKVNFIYRRLVALRVWRGLPAGEVPAGRGSRKLGQRNKKVGESGALWWKMCIFAADSLRSFRAAACGAPRRRRPGRSFKPSKAHAFFGKHRGKARRQGARVPACGVPQGAAGGGRAGPGDAQGRVPAVPRALSRERVGRADGPAAQPPEPLGQGRAAALPPVRLGG